MSNINRNKYFTVKEFKNEMGKNPLGTDPSIRKVGEYIVEFYPETFSLTDNPNPRLQVYAIATDEEDHYRKWKLIADEDSFESPPKQKYRQITAEQIREIDRKEYPDHEATP